MFANQRGNSGVGGLLGVAVVLAAWLGVGGIMWNEYVAPQVTQADQCQVVCRQVSGQQSEG